MMLVDDGLVDLDADASTYVTRVPVPDGVTVRHLLQHRSGIPNYTDLPTFFVRALTEPGRTWRPEETFEVVADVDPAFEPGDQFAYSNTGYLVLGLLIEEVSGRSYGDELQSRIVQPLRMNTTYLAGLQTGQEPFPAFTTLGGIDLSDYDYTGVATDAWAAGAVVSSAADLHKLMGALADGRLVSEGSLDAMTEGDRYGMGLVLFRPEVFGHDGGIPGYLTLVAHAPDSGTTAFWIATNDSARLVGVEAVLDRMVGR